MEIQHQSIFRVTSFLGKANCRSKHTIVGWGHYQVCRVLYQLLGRQMFMECLLYINYQYVVLLNPSMLDLVLYKQWLVSVLLVLRLGLKPDQNLWPWPWFCLALALKDWSGFPCSGVTSILACQVTLTTWEAAQLVFYLDTINSTSFTSTEDNMASLCYSSEFSVGLIQ